MKSILRVVISVFLLISISLSLSSCEVLSTVISNITNGNSSSLGTNNNDKTYSATEIYNQSVKYVGEITTYDKYGDGISLGTGFVISSDGKIVTNYHVIEDAYSANIEINEKTYKIVSVLAYDENIDLAVLKVNAVGLAYAKISIRSVNVGETVYAIGSSRGMTNTYSQGIVTYADRVVEGVSHVQHDASITNGNSGGPLINSYGEVIGINTWGISDSQNLNFAVSASELNNLVYGKPISLSTNTENKLSAHEKLKNWLIDNQNRATDSDISFVQHAYDASYSLNYSKNNYDLYIFISSDDYYVGLYLDEDPSNCYYGWYWEIPDTGSCYKVSGYINAHLYTKNTILTGYKYSANNYYLSESSVVSLAQSSISLAITWFRTFLTTHPELGLSIEDFGFTFFE